MIKSISREIDIFFVTKLHENRKKLMIHTKMKRDTLFITAFISGQVYSNSKSYKRRELHLKKLEQNRSLRLANF